MIAPQPQQRTDLIRRASRASVACAALLATVKLGAFLVTNSVAVLSSLIDSLLDLLASSVNLVALRHARKPADREHRFGHGKSEPLAALAQSAFVTGSALFVLFEAGRRLIEPASIGHPEIGIGVMLFSMVATGVLVGFQRHVVRKTGSLAIEVDALHYLGDVLLYLSVIASLALTTVGGWRYSDPLFGIAITGYLLRNAYGIARRSIDQLLDREIPDSERDRIRRIALTHPAVRNLHDLRTRTSGHTTFIQLHLEVPGTLSLTRAHRIADQVETEIRRAFPEAEVIIHEDPHGLREERPSFKD